ncbi:MAG: leucine-rich repeat domain-containing protein [Candidatus Thorarchaeota archaeon]|nr:leucine-rich repeat domain-containing protein [Candidatus Thorarchaeota archaeon]
MVDSVIEFLRHSRKKERVSYRHDTKEINLSGMSIFEVDLTEAGALSELRTLDVSENRLEHVELDFLSDCSDLRTINLGDNRIQKLDIPSLRNLSHLEELLLSNNLIKHGNFDGLAGCNHLEVLNLSNNHMHEIDLSFLSTCPSLTTLNLQNNQLASIDMNDLENCRMIQNLDLSHNWIREIDLGPFSDNKNLKHIDLSQNPLSRIDLAPLTNCHALENLILDWTQIMELDIYPLSKCHNLRKLGISHNRVEIIDLYPLIACSKLESLDISGINAMDIDLWPLFSLPHLNEVEVSRRTNLEIRGAPISISWLKGLDGLQERVSFVDVKAILAKVGLSGFIKYASTLERKAGPLGRFYLRMFILESFGFPHFIGFDGDVIQLLESIEDTGDFQLIQSKLRTNLLFELDNQLANGGSTHFLDLDKSRTIPELAVLAPRVLDLRKQEVESILLNSREGRIDLTPLWETSYGFEMLSALCLGLSTDEKGLDTIRRELSKLGIQLDTVTASEVHTWESKLSEGLRQFIFMRALQCS